MKTIMQGRRNNDILIDMVGNVKTPSVITDYGRIDYNFSPHYYFVLSQRGSVTFNSPGNMDTQCFCDAGKALCDHFKINYDK